MNTREKQKEAGIRNKWGGITSEEMKKNTIKYFRTVHENEQKTLQEQMQRANAAKRAAVVDAMTIPGSKASQTIKQRVEDETAKLRAKGSKNRPINSVIQLMITNLKMDRKIPKSFERLCEETASDINDIRLEPTLQKSPRITFDRLKRLYSYKSRHENIKGLEQLWKFIKANPFGCTGLELADSYPGVLRDLEKLVESGHVLTVMNSSAKTPILYPAPQTKTPQVDEKFKKMWYEINVPKDVGEQVVKLGLKSSKQQEEEREVALGKRTREQVQAEKKRKRRKRSGVPKNLTNQHLNLDLSVKQDE